MQKPGVGRDGEAGDDVVGNVAATPTFFQLPADT
jgi:hypothetical protein